MTLKINYNERSWAIDIISEINSITNRLNLSIKRAGGEHTLSTIGKRVFPDVLLFADKNGSVVVQGWELKMPDTEITNNELISNATDKANKLKLTSFIIWNVKEAVLYINENDTFIPSKSWKIQNITKRTDVFNHQKEWKELLKEIIIDLDKFLDNNYIIPVGIDDVISDSLYKDMMSQFMPLQSDIFKSAIASDALIGARVNVWYEENKLEFKGLSSVQALAQINIINWINRFIFAHYLKLFKAEAEVVETINGDSDINSAIDIFNEITKKCDFMNVFKPILGQEHVHPELWKALVNLNIILTEIKLESVSQKSLHMVIDTTLSYSKTKIAGQFSTPSSLAEYLVGITIMDRTQNVIDPCCGTGTIAKAAYKLKLQHLTESEALKTVWASDKFVFPLQLCSIAMSDPNLMGEVVQVFQKDVFFIEPQEFIEFINPYNAKLIKRELPSMHAVVSNLPFVRFEDLRKLNPEINSVRETLKKEKFNLSDKSDLYAYITLSLDKILSDKGRIGLVVSNSWLGVNWGDNFKKFLLEKYNILYVIISSNGRWFSNADVVTNIIILEKKTKLDSKKKIGFITTIKNINCWDKKTIKSMVNETIIDQSNIKLKYISKQTYSKDKIKNLEKYGLSWNSFFVNFDWFDKVKEHLVPLNSLFDIKRGERRGWDKMFYPEKNHSIENEFIRPVLKSTNKLGGEYIISANDDAFCCSESIDNLKKYGKKDALAWITKFSLGYNKKGNPLKDVLKRPNMHWYEMKPETLADIVVSLNPDKKLCFYRLKERSFVNQRLIRLTAKKQTTQINLVHALLNSAIGMFLLESIGFGRGLGALDINASKLSKKMYVLDCSRLNDTKAKSICDSFDLLGKRPIKNLTEELKMTDRIAFDKEVIKAYDIPINVQDVYSSLFKLYNIRQTVRK